MKKILSLFTLGILFLALNLPLPAPAASEKDIKDPLEANVTLRVNWNVDQGDIVNKGFLTITIKGLLRHNKEWSPPEEEMMTAMVPYVGENIRATYRYEEKITQKEPPEGCDELMAEYSGHNVVTLRPIPAPGNLLLHYLGEIYSQVQYYERLIPSDVKPMLNNYYELFLEAKKEKISGRRRGYNDCEFKEDSKTIPIGMIGIRYLFDESGRMRGQSSWNSKQESGAPTFGVRVSNLPKTMEKKPFSPEQGPGPVTYNLSWNIKEPALLNLERKVKGKWMPLTEDLKEVTVGERIELRGVVIPADKDPRAGQWEIDGNDNQNYLKEFKANKDRGEVIRLKDKDLVSNSVVFYWYKGGSGKVKYSAVIGEEDYSEQADFRIRKPDYDVTWENSPDSHLGELTAGNPNLRDRWPKDNWPPDRPTYEEEGLGGAISGLEYNGILFQCENKSDIKGETEWVQIITEKQKFSTPAAEFESDAVTGLDHVYPNAVGDSFYDAPAIPASEKEYLAWNVKMDFDLYLMFRPKGDGNEWVPLKLIKWGWQGGLARRDLESPWEETMSVEPVAEQGNEPTQRDAEEYPEWTRNSGEL